MRTAAVHTWRHLTAVLLVLAGAVVPAVGGGAASAGPPTQLVVRFEPDAVALARQRALDRHHVTVVDSLPGTDYVLVEAPTPVRASALAAEAAVARAHRPARSRAMGRVQGGEAPNDPLFKAQWHLRTVGIPRAWEVSRGDGVVVAVLDTGVAYEDFGPFKRAPDLAGTKFVPGWDFIENDDHPNDYPVGGKGSHGTAMAGTIAQTTDNGLGGAGVAPGAAIMPVRVLAPDERGTSFDIAKGLRFAADHGARVANLSLGTKENAPELADAVAYAIAKGVTVVASSGDDGSEGLTYPAAYPDVLAVGATLIGNARARYSNYGPDLDLVAPGGALEEDENGDDLDDGVVQQALYEMSTSFCFCFRQGTSSAAAHVSGVAALVLAAGKATTPAEVRELLVNTAADLGPPGRDGEYGAGLVQATRALGMPALPGEPPVTVAPRHDHDEDAGEAARPLTRADRRRNASRGAAGEGGSDTGPVAWVGDRWPALVVVATVVIVALVAGARRRRALPPGT